MMSVDYVLLKLVRSSGGMGAVNKWPRRTDRFMLKSFCSALCMTNTNLTLPTRRQNRSSSREFMKHWLTKIKYLYKD
jgi:hypothetical protein